MKLNAKQFEALSKLAAGASRNDVNGNVHRWLCRNNLVVYVKPDRWVLTAAGVEALRAGVSK